jgi:hypothetical protein
MKTDTAYQHEHYKSVMGAQSDIKIFVGGVPIEFENRFRNNRVNSDSKKKKK